MAIRHFILNNSMLLSDLEWSEKIGLYLRAVLAKCWKESREREIFYKQ